MFHRFTSLALAIALCFAVGGTSVFADTPTNTDTPGNAGVTPPATPTSARKEHPDEKLRAGLVKLVADTKAGRVTLSAPSQIQPVRGNNLSKGKKIALGVGIAAVVVVVVAAIYVRHHLFDDFRPFSQH